MSVVHVGMQSSFISLAADSFERCAPGQNRYYLVAGAEGSRGAHDESRTVTFVATRSPSMLRLLRAARTADMIVAHGMTPTGALAFLASRRVTVRVWSGWGFDYYGGDESADQALLGPHTLAHLRECGQVPDGAGASPSRSARLRSRLLRRAARRTSVFSAPIPSDLEVFVARFPEFHGVYRQINYATVEESFAHHPTGTGSENILVGNSALASNNHFDSFEALRRVDLGERKIITPLSYGNADYRQCVLSAGRRLFGDAFVPLVEFMPLDEYLDVVGSCGVVVMDHRRQQALGNLGAAIYGGAHVYLNESSPTLAFLRSLGVVLHSTNQLGTEPLPTGRLPDDLVERNRAALRTYWGQDRVEANVRELLTLIQR